MLGVRNFYIKNTNEKEKEITNNSSLNEINDLYKDQIIALHSDIIEDLYF